MGTHIEWIDAEHAAVGVALAADCNSDDGAAAWLLRNCGDDVDAEAVLIVSNPGELAVAISGDLSVLHNLMSQAQARLEHVIASTTTGDNSPTPDLTLPPAQTV